jgi:hypothetical protein
VCAGDPAHRGLVADTLQLLTLCRAGGKSILADKNL